MNLHTPRGYRIVTAWFGVPKWVVLLISLMGCKGWLVLAAGGAEEEEPPFLHFFSTIPPPTHPLANTMSSFKFITVIVWLVGWSVNSWGDSMGRGGNRQVGEVAVAMVGGMRDN